MTRFAVILRSLQYHWRTHCGVVLGAAVAATVLVGALVVGDSVRQTLHDLALLRLGETRLAMQTGDRLVRADLADDVAKPLGATVAPVFMLGGTAVTPDGSARATSVQVLGVDDRFWRLGNTSLVLAADTCAINTELAAQLKVAANDTIVLRVPRPSALPRDAPLATVDDAVAAVRVKVAEVVGPERLGRFNLRAEQVAPMSVFVPLATLQAKLDEPGAANAMLVGEAATAAQADAAVADAWKLADVGFAVRRVADSPRFELRSDRVFFDAPADLPGTRYLTYLVNTLQTGERSTPYSMVTATDDPALVGAMSDDAIVLTRWLAADLGAAVDDRVTLRYYAIGPMRELIEREAAFTVDRIVDIEGAYDDPSLMPAFPGLVDAEHCRAWDPGFAIDTTRIRDKDEAYWDEHRGTPKAYITYRAGQRLWSNRFGDTTAVRFSLTDDPAAATAHDAAAFVRAQLDPQQFGLRFEPVREQALAASQQGPAAYFGYMFIGFSFFIIVAAVLLMAMLFVFSVEQRTAQIGTLKAIGFTAADTRRLLIAEGAALALVGVLIGTGLGIAYTKLVLLGLSTWWANAVNATPIVFHMTAGSLVGGAASALLVCIGAMFVALRKRLRLPARELMSGDVAVSAAAPTRPLLPFIVAAVGSLAAMALVGLSFTMEGGGQAGAFFGAGFLLLVAAGAAAAALLRWIAGWPAARALTIGRLAIRNTTSRRGRSLAVVILLAAGVFLVIAVGANRKSASSRIDEPRGPAGGFNLIAESTLPVYQDITRDDDGQPEPTLAGATVVPFRVASGDDASCLNLNRAATPRLIGVDVSRLKGRFTLIDSVNEASWYLLTEAEREPGVVPAIADQPTAAWGLGLSIGDTLDYTDERGRPFKVRLVGLLAPSTLQGNLLILNDDFTRLYPSTSGYRLFLIDTGRPDDVSAHLTRRYTDRGMQVTPSRQRLAAFLSVENTYLSIFQSLGALGLLIGTVGLGVVVLRNMLERRRELALLRAVGFGRAGIGRLIVVEHAGLLLAGMFAGVVTALIAVWPALASVGDVVPVGALAQWVAGIGVAGGLWIVAATAIALRGRLLDALRSE